MSGAHLLLSYKDKVPYEQLQFIRLPCHMGIQHLVKEIVLGDLIQEQNGSIVTQTLLQRALQCKCTVQKGNNQVTASRKTNQQSIWFLC